MQRNKYALTYKNIVLNLSGDYYSQFIISAIFPYVIKITKLKRSIAYSLFYHNNNYFSLKYFLFAQLMAPPPP